VSFLEDANRTGIRTPWPTWGCCGGVAAGLLKQNPGTRSIQTRRLNAALDRKYFERVLREFKADLMR